MDEYLRVSSHRGILLRTLSLAYRLLLRILGLFNLGIQASVFRQLKLTQTRLSEFNDIRDLAS